MADAAPRTCFDPFEGEEQVRRDDRDFVFHSWSAQGHIDPLPIVKGEGVRFWDYAGNSYLDFSSQLVNLNLGHQHPRLVEAVQEQAARMATIQPSFASDVRGQLAREIVQRAFEGARSVFFTNGGAESNEYAVRMARLHTGRRKVLAQYRSYHGSTGTAISLTGDPRRWANDTIDGSVVHFFGPYQQRSPFWSISEEQEAARALDHLEQLIILEGADTIAAILLETIPGTNGVLVPPTGYLAGVREICDRYGILLVFDEVMVGFGRVGEWFAFHAYDVRPDLVTFAKGVNSGYVPLGGVVVSDKVHESFVDVPFPGGLTYSGHPLACAAGVATFEIFREEEILERVRDLGERVIAPKLAAIAEKHSSVGSFRGLGMFWAVELVRNPLTQEPLVPFNARGAETAPMDRFGTACRERGLWPWLVANRLQIAPPLIISEEDLTAGLDIIDSALSVVDHDLSSARSV